jgi:ABC-type methionine transport system ATPase subunit
VLSILVRDFGLDVDVVGGRVETIGGTRFGRLQLEVLDGSATADDEERLRKAVARLQDEGVLAGVAS